MTTRAMTPDQRAISQRLDAMLDLSTFRSDGQLRSIGKKLRTDGKKLTNEQAGLLMDAGIFDIYSMGMPDLMPLYYVLEQLDPELHDNDELVDLWGAGQFCEYMLARICITLMRKPEVTEQIISTMALMDLKRDRPEGFKR